MRRGGGWRRRRWRGGGGVGASNMERDESTGHKMGEVESGINGSLNHDFLGV